MFKSQINVYLIPPLHPPLESVGRVDMIFASMMLLVLEIFKFQIDELYHDVANSFFLTDSKGGCRGGIVLIVQS